MSTSTFVLVEERAGSRTGHVAAPRFLDSYIPRPGDASSAPSFRGLFPGSGGWFLKGRVA